MRMTGLVVATILVVGLAACSADDGTGPATARSPVSASVQQTGCIGTVKPGGSAEGEVFGSIYVDGARSCNTYTVSLEPYADAQARLHMSSYKADLTADPQFVNMFEWWEPIAGGPCTATDGTLAGYVASGAGSVETIHAPTSPKEGHCVRPGRYHFALEGDLKQFDAEYIQWSEHTATSSSGTLYIESAAYNSSLLNSWQDLVINVDLTSSHPGDTPILDIQNALANPYASSFTNEAAPVGTAADWFRFSAARSTPHWTVDTRGSALARLYFDGTDLTQATAYYDYKPEGHPVLRLHRFPNPTTASKTYVVGLELMQPDEMPATAPSVTRTVTINRLNPDLQVGTVTGPSSALAGQQVSFSVQEKNAATNSFAVAEAPWTGRLYLSTDQTFSPSTDVLIGSYVENSPISASSSLTRTYTGTIPSGQPSGTYYIFAQVDATDAILEGSLEGNNVNSAPPAIAVSAQSPLVVEVAADHLGALGAVRPNQTCKWGATANKAGVQYTWQMHTPGTPAFKWVLLGSGSILSKYIDSSSFDIRAIGTLNGQADTVVFTVSPSSSGFVCTGTILW